MSEYLVKRLLSTPSIEPEGMGVGVGEGWVVEWFYERSGGRSIGKRGDQSAAHQHCNSYDQEPPL